MHHFFTQYNWLRYACTGKLNVLCFLNFFIIIRNALMSHQVLFIISFTFYNFFCDTDQIAQHCVCFFCRLPKLNNFLEFCIFFLLVCRKKTKRALNNFFVPFLISKKKVEKAKQQRQGKRDTSRE